MLPVSAGVVFFQIWSQLLASCRQQILVTGATKCFHLMSPSKKRKSQFIHHNQNVRMFTITPWQLKTNVTLYFSFSFFSFFCFLNVSYFVQLLLTAALKWLLISQKVKEKKMFELTICVFKSHKNTCLCSQFWFFHLSMNAAVTLPASLQHTYKSTDRKWVT